MDMSIPDQIIHTTVRIECVKQDGTSGSGTGFIFNFCQNGGKHVPTIITNKHVVEDTTEGTFHMTLRGDDDAPLYGQKVRVPVAGFEEHWVKHPDDSIDLTAFPLAPVLHWLDTQGHKVFYIPMDSRFLADDEFMKDLVAVEDILMVGYPNGLWDSVNNLPIVRRGVTATPPYIDFNGRPEFMIDCACFPGSSGSPVVLYNLGSHVKKGGGLVIGQGRVKLIGILWGGPQHTAEGDIKAVPVPSSFQPIALSRIPNNLGYCVKVQQLLAFEEHFSKLVAAEKDVAKSEEVGAVTEQTETS